MQQALRPLAPWECSFSGKKIKGRRTWTSRRLSSRVGPEREKASARQCLTLSESASDGSDWQKGEVLIHQNKRDQDSWTSRETGCSCRGSTDETVITKQNSPLFVYRMDIWKQQGIFWPWFALRFVSAHECQLPGRTWLREQGLSFE